MRDHVWKRLLDQIQSGRLLTGQRLPSEKELQRIYGVSRTPIRQALDKLALEGHIVRQPGRGTFVSNIRPGTPIGKLSSFSYYYSQHMASIEALTLKITVKPPSPVIRKALGLDGAQPAVHLERVRLYERKPVAYLSDVLAPRFPARPFRQDRTFQSMMMFMRDTFAVRCTQAKEEVDAIIPSKKERTILGLGERCPVLQVKRNVYDEKGGIVLYSRYIVDSDRWKYRTSLIV